MRVLRVLCRNRMDFCILVISVAAIVSDGMMLDERQVEISIVGNLSLDVCTGNGVSFSPQSKERI